MRISDWSSDVCSSDLLDQLVLQFADPDERDLVDGDATAVRRPHLGLGLKEARVLHAVARAEDVERLFDVTGDVGVLVVVFEQHFDSLEADESGMPSMARQHFPIESRPGRPWPGTRKNGLRSEDSRVGKECVSTCRSRWS